MSLLTDGSASKAHIDEELLFARIVVQGKPAIKFCGVVNADENLDSDAMYKYVEQTLSSVYCCDSSLLYNNSEYEKPVELLKKIVN